MADSIAGAVSKATPWGAIASGLGSVATIGFGIADRIRGKKEYDKAQSFFEQNKFDIPEGAKASLGIAQRGAESMRMPGQGLAEQRLGQLTAGGVEQARRVGRNPSDILATLSSLYGTQMQGEQNLAMQGAQQYQANQRNFQQALSNYGNLETQKWQYNVLYPYQQMLGRAGQFQDRGTQELNTGFMGAAQTGAGLMQSNAQERMYQQFLKSKGLDGSQGSSLGVGGQYQDSVSPYGGGSFGQNFG